MALYILFLCSIHSKFHASRVIYAYRVVICAKGRVYDVHFAMLKGQIPLV